MDTVNAYFQTSSKRGAEYDLWLSLTQEKTTVNKRINGYQTYL